MTLEQEIAFGKKAMGFLSKYQDMIENSSEVRYPILKVKENAPRLFDQKAMAKLREMGIITGKND